MSAETEKKGISFTIPRWVIQVGMLVVLIANTYLIYTLAQPPKIQILEIVQPITIGFVQIATILIYRYFLKWVWGVKL